MEILRWLNPRKLHPSMASNLRNKTWNSICDHINFRCVKMIPAKVFCNKVSCCSYFLHFTIAVFEERSKVTKKCQLLEKWYWKTYDTVPFNILLEKKFLFSLCFLFSIVSFVVYIHTMLFYTMFAIAAW